jgi:hypothetical protein
MNAPHLGFFNTAGTDTRVRLIFSTHQAAGGNVAPSSAFEAADLRIYKATPGAAFSATQRSSTAGITMTSPFDSLTGVHAIDIDLTNNADAGFYVEGLYAIVLSPSTGGSPAETIDGETITGVVLGYFGIGPWIKRFSFANDSGLKTEFSGTATAGGASTITLPATQSSGEATSTTDDFYNDMMIHIVAGTGATQINFISDYVGATKVATVSSAWGTTPDNTSQFNLFPNPGNATDIAAAILSAADANPIAANIKEVDDDATAAVNLESYLDGSEFMPVDAHKQEWTVTGTTLQPKKPDGTTNTSYSRTLGTDAGAEPIVSST